MFYNKTGTIAFIVGYVGALLYTGINLAGRDFWAPWGFYVLAVWVLLGASLPLGLLQARYSSRLRRLGGVMLAFVLHLSAAFLVLNLWTLFAAFSAFPPPSSRATALVINATLLWIAWGVARAQRIAVRSFDVEPACRRGHPPIKIVAVADIHAGGVVERSYLRRLRKRIECCRPDIILLLGDVTDGDIACAAEVGLGDFLSALKAPLGKYAVLGNHDIYAGAKKMRRILTDAGVVVLQDASVVIDDAFVLVGRNDPRGIHFGIPRATLASLLADRPDLPVVVADHTPQDLKEAANCGVDLQLSGHTHGGQVFPFNLMMKRMYGISSGLRHDGKTAICVSSGAGLWTMPLRTVTNSEIVLCTLHFAPDSRS